MERAAPHTGIRNTTTEQLEEGENILKRIRMLQRTPGGSLGLRTAAASILMLLLCMPAVSPAASLSGDSSTYLQSRQAEDGSRILGGYEYLDFAVQNIGDETITFHTGGWLRQDFQTEEYGTRSNSDLQYSYLSFKSKTDNTMVNLGARDGFRRRGCGESRRYLCAH